MTPEHYQETVRPGLARAMGRPSSWARPDPLHSAEDAEALWTWLEGQGYEVNLDSDAEHGVTAQLDFAGPREVCFDLFPGDAGWSDDPALRRRTALVLAAWQAVQAMEAAP